MVYTPPRDWVPAASVLASQLNEQVRDNENAIWTGTTAGDMDYYSSATQKSRIAIGAAGKSLVSTGTAPEWGYPSLPGCLITNTATQTIEGGSPSASEYAIFNTEDYDSSNFTDLSALNTSITIPSGMGGLYNITFSTSVLYALTAVGYIHFRIVKTTGATITVIGGDSLYWSYQYNAAFKSVHASMILAAADTIRIYITSFMATNTIIGPNTGATTTYTRLSAYKWA